MWNSSEYARVYIKYVIGVCQYVGNGIRKHVIAIKFSFSFQQELLVGRSIGKIDLIHEWGDQVGENKIIVHDERRDVIVEEK